LCFFFFLCLFRVIVLCVAVTRSLTTVSHVFCFFFVIIVVIFVVVFLVPLHAPQKGGKLARLQGEACDWR